MQRKHKPTKIGDTLRWVGNFTGTKYISKIVSLSPLRVKIINSFNTSDAGLLVGDEIHPDDRIVTNRDVHRQIKRGKRWVSVQKIVTE